MVRQVQSGQKNAQRGNPAALAAQVDPSTSPGGAADGSTLASDGDSPHGEAERREITLV